MKKKAKAQKPAKAKSIIIGRIPKGAGDEYSKILVKYFTVNDPHLKEVYPFKEEEFPNIAEVRFKSFKIVSYLTEGKDLLLNDLVEIDIVKKATTLRVKGKQEIK